MPGSVALVAGEDYGFAGLVTPADHLKRESRFHRLQAEVADLIEHEQAGPRHEGARLVDVREPDEFAPGAIAGALNISLDTLGDRVDEIADRPVVLYCQSGMRSQRGWQILTKQQSRSEVYTLGAMERWTT